MKYLPKINVKAASVKIMLLVVAVLALITLLADLSVINMTASIAAIITIGGALFLLSEVGWTQAVKTKGISWLDLVIFAVAILAIIGGIAALIGTTISFLVPYMVMVKIAFLVAIVIEIFRK